MQLSQCVSLEDFRHAAEASLPKAAFEYLDSGSSDEQTLHENETSFHRLMIVPRVLKSISHPDMTTTLFGRTLSLPFGFAPSAMQLICHPDGEVAPSRIAQERNIITCISTLSTKSFS
jgi:(S)-2-hydroxy-acid oxidase